MTQAHVGSSHLGSIRNPKYPIAVKVSIIFVFDHLERKKAIVSTIFSLTLEVCQEQGWVIGWKIVGLWDF